MLRCFFMLIGAWVTPKVAPTALDTIAPPTVFTAAGPGGGGATYSPSISPHDADVIYLACDMAGMYRTTDAGYHWSLYHYNQMVSSIKAQVQFTSDPNLLYSISRSLNYDMPFRNYLVKSTDAGNTWQPMYDPTATGVHRIFADPSSTQRLLLNEYDRLFFSNDGGASYTTAYVPPTGLAWLGGVFWDGNDIYVATGDGLLVSHDGGTSFAVENYPGLPIGTDIYLLNGAKEAGQVKLFAIPVDSTLLAPWADWRSFGGGYQGLFSLTPTPGASWSNIRNNIPAGQEILFVDLATHEKDIVYAATHQGDWPYIYKSTNGGANWAEVFLTSNNQNITTSYSGDGGVFTYNGTGGRLGFDVAANDPNVVFASNYGSPHLSYDGGATWRQCFSDSAYQHPPATLPSPTDAYRTSGVDVTSTHHLTWLGQNELFAASTDFGNQFSSDGGQTWTFGRNTLHQQWGYLENPNWYVIAKHPSNSTLYAAVTAVNDIYLEYRISDDELGELDGKIFTSSNNGQTWSVLHDFGYPVVWFVQDPEAPNRMFASVVHYPNGGIYRSEDSGTTWTKLPLPARTQGRPYTIRLLGSGDLVASFSGRKVPGTSSDSLTVCSGVFYSDNNGDTWSDRSHPGMLRYTKDITVDPYDATKNTWYANVWGGLAPNYDGNGGLYRTTDRGLSWVRVFEHKRAESITVHPVDPNVAYLATEFGGLWRTGNLGNASPSFHVVGSFPYPRPKRIFFNPYNPCEMWVTTMGAAVWVGTESAFTASITLTPGNYCQGAPTTLSASSGVSWLWGNGLTQQVFPASPAQATDYFVTVTDGNGCTATASATVQAVGHDPALLTAASGSFSDGSGSNNYLDLTDCFWRIQPPGATAITLDFSAFDTEQDWDFVRVYDGPTVADPLLGAFSGTNLPPQLVSGGGAMLVQFESDWTVNGAGWSASYQSCVADLTVAADPIPAGTYSAGSTLTSTGRVAAGTAVVFSAGQSVLLSPGFEVQTGGVLEAVTGNGCQ